MDDIDYNDCSAIIIGHISYWYFQGFILDNATISYFII